MSKKHSYAEAVYNDAVKRAEDAVRRAAEVNGPYSYFEVEFVLPRITGQHNVIPDSDEIPWDD